MQQAAGPTLAPFTASNMSLEYDSRDPQIYSGPVKAGGFGTKDYLQVPYDQSSDPALTRPPPPLPLKSQLPYDAKARFRPPSRQRVLFVSYPRARLAAVAMWPLVPACGVVTRAGARRCRI